MGQISEALDLMVKTRNEYFEFKKLRSKCYKVFSPRIRKASVREIAEKDWPILQRMVGLLPNDNIDIYAIKLERGQITRKEFKDVMAESIKVVDDIFYEKFRKAAEAEKAFNKIYDEYFEKNNPSLLVPGIKDSFMKFLIK